MKTNIKTNTPNPRRAKTDADTRRGALAKIHIAKTQLGIEDADYRAMLTRVAGVSSAADLLPHQVDDVLTELRRLGFVDHGSNYGALKKRFARDGNERLMASIRKMLAAANRPWGYADAMAKRMCGIERLEWCGTENLQKIHTALKYDERRRMARAA
jgi:phage gp16-like protein